MALNISTLDLLASIGVTVLHPISPFVPGNLTEYMDRIAQLGMYFQYDLQHVWTNATEVTIEVNKYKDHPAMFGWYIADEPDGPGISPASLIAANNLIKSLDPFHPTAI